MKNIELISNLDMEAPSGMEKDLVAKEIYNGPMRRIIDIRLQNGATLPRHKANEPITVLCLSGKGMFHAGAELDDAQEMVPGALITLEPGVEHDLVADPAVHILVTRFKAN
jgi:quercetin dioxygenase-like cupin family protein